MKKILLLLITLFIVCTSCGNSDTEEPVSMDELMKIVYAAQHSAQKLERVGV